MNSKQFSVWFEIRWGKTQIVWNINLFVSKTKQYFIPKLIVERINYKIEKYGRGIRVRVLALTKDEK